MNKARHRDEDGMFRWARTEMKKEMLMGQSSYARIAGLQSESGRVVITRVAGSELEYKRKLSMYRKDMTVSVNNIRREQIKMRRKIGKYMKKLKQTKIEKTKRLREEQKRDDERASLEALHLRLKFEAAADPQIKEIERNTHSADSGIDEPPNSPAEVNFTEDSVYIQTGQKSNARFTSSESDQESANQITKLGNSNINKEPRAFASYLPMINEDTEKENEEQIRSETENVSTEAKHNKSTCDTVNIKNSAIDVRVTDDEMSVSSFGKKRQKKREVSFSDIIKLKYSSTKRLFDLVHTLAKKHGIVDVVEKVPDPRDNVVLRGTTDDTFKLQAAVLYPMKYGYQVENDTEGEHLMYDVPEQSPVFSNQSSNIANTELVNNGHDVLDDARKLSLDERREMFLSGRHSISVEGEHKFPSVRHEIVTRDSLKSRDKSMSTLVDKFTQLKLERTERNRRVSETDKPSRYLSVPKPSSSRSTKSLPPLSKEAASRSQEKVSWTQAFGLIRAIHSLDDEL